MATHKLLMHTHSAGGFQLGHKVLTIVSPSRSYGKLAMGCYLRMPVLQAVAVPSSLHSNSQTHELEMDMQVFLSEALWTIIM